MPLKLDIPLGTSLNEPFAEIGHKILFKKSANSSVSQKKPSRPGTRSITKIKVKNAIKQLLAEPTNNATCHNELGISNITHIINQYVSTPWDAKSRKLFNLNNYAKQKNEVKASKADNSILRQHHAGNLFEHSQWCALKIIDWHNKNDPIMMDIDLETAVVSAFFHDIGKGYDCVFNTYSPKKYNGRGDGDHPEFSGDVILGKIPFKICSCTNREINMKVFINENFPSIDVDAVAICAYMHWQFGLLNMPDKQSDASVDNYTTYLNKLVMYINKFIEYCTMLRIKDTLKLLKLCMVIACADVAGTTKENIPLLTSYNVIKLRALPNVYLPTNPWKRFKMDAYYLKHYTAVINIYTLWNNKRGDTMKILDVKDL